MAANSFLPFSGAASLEGLGAMPSPLIIFLGRPEFVTGVPAGYGKMTQAVFRHERSSDLCLFIL